MQSSTAFRRTLVPYVTVAGMAAALLILGAMQYRWSQQVSQAERARINTQLQISVAQYRLEFARDLIALCTGFQSDPEIAADHDWARYARQGVDYLRLAPDARLAGDVYVLPVSGPALVLNRAEGRFDETKESASLHALFQRLLEKQERTAERPAERPGEPPQGRGGGGFRQFGWMLEGKEAALVHGLYSRGQGTPPHLEGFTVITLDREYLSQHFLPELAARHFSGPDGFLFQVAVFGTGDEAHPLYQSSPFAPASFHSADVNIGIFDNRGRPQPPPGEPDGGRRGPQRGRGFRGGAPFTLLTPEVSSQWKLAVKHPLGSVEQAVETLRRRNLAISFAILLLLGGSMAMIVVSTQRAQRLARLQMEFVAGVSHELRTPLTVISSAAQNLTDGIVEGKEQTQLYGTLIRNESRRLNGMMEQILQFASGQKRRKYEPAPTAVVELIENALALAASMITEENVVVERHIAAGLPEVMVESSALMQCLHNLIVNAIKYGGEQKWMRIRAWADAEWVRIAVEDHGLGIEPSELPHLFDAFYRGRTVTAAQIHGTGLGLSLARTFAEEAGGGISVESRPGVGSTFTLKLPVRRTITASEQRKLEERTV